MKLTEGQERPATEPLSLDQLRTMGGKPVFIVEHPNWGHWELSEDADDYVRDRDTDFYGMKSDDPDGKHGLHVLGWLAYAAFAPQTVAALLAENAELKAKYAELNQFENTNTARLLLRVGELEKRNKALERAIKRMGYKEFCAPCKMCKNKGPISCADPDAKCKYGDHVSWQFDLDRFAVKEEPQ
jgi:hypothetical protein